MSEATPTHADVLSFWFGALDGDGLPDGPTRARWFGGGESFDAEIHDRFAGLVATAQAGGLEAWAASPDALLGLVLVLDQFPRNLYRGDGRSFASDARALELSRNAIERGWDAKLRPVERLFLYMPFQHAEDRSTQQQSCALYERLLRDAPAAGRELFDGSHDYAERHRVVIERFGRFPGRNDALGRASTPEERAFLAEHPAGF